MRLDFSKETDIKASKLSKFEHCISKETTVVLHHSVYCGHCVAMRDEFDKFVSGTKHNVVEVEGSVLSNLSANKKVFSKVTPKDGVMYFPMILIFIQKDTMAYPKKYVYEGPRTAQGLKTFIEEKSYKNKSPVKIKDGRRKK